MRQVKIESGSHPDADLCVIGAGPAGRAIAMAGAALGLSVVLVHGGGDEPSCAELLLPFLYRVACRASDVPAPARDLQAAWQAVRVAASPDRRMSRLSAMNVRVLRGRARFVGRSAVRVGSTEIRARRFVLATGEGSTAAGWDAALFDRVAQGEHIDVKGSHPHAVGMAQALRRLGGRAALRLDGDLLSDFDHELVRPLAQALARDGVVARQAEPQRSTDPTAYRLEKTDQLPGTKTEFEHAGITCDANGLVLTKSLRTTNPRIYALGSCARSYSPQAIQAQVRCVLKAAFFKLPVEFHPLAVPALTFTDPPIAVVGLNEAQARQHGDVRIRRWPFAETDVGHLTGERAGHIKIVTRRDGRLLGAGIVGPGSHEQIGFWTLACATGQTIQGLGEIALPGHTLAEISQNVIRTATAERLRRPWLKRTVDLIRYFG